MASSNQISIESSENNIASQSFNKCEDEVLINILCELQILLQKSQVPNVKIKKNKAFLKMQNQMFQATGTKIDTKTLAKKIANIKTKLKKKSDIHRTGNKPIKLSASEVKLANLLDTEKNPTFTQIDGAISAGIDQTPTSSVAETNSVFSNSSKSQTIFLLSSSVEFSGNVKSSFRNTSSQASRLIPKRLKLPSKTKKTIKWTNTELHRVVMLEQLKYYRLKSLKLKYTTPHHINEEEIDIVVDINVDGNKT
ncbi:uncharacterized protein LOC124813619 [Hydra vulgaris]|uniref:uncharacterized protein LOC124813619 n=1 Tax=Hydra vulgaris TaxID=6087 RepID=UPI001F5E75DD|nr:uncharacterized protein LOC124813619 isoform X1 [Hydra vulgaris]